MAFNRNVYDMEEHIAELYDRLETETDDVELILRLIEGRGPLNILEPFCGTGRILIPLADEGHRLTGIDQSRGMIAQASKKIAALPEYVQVLISLKEADVLGPAWPAGFDLVVLGGNCFYELATPEEQEEVIARAAAALMPGGSVYIDNDHMEGDLELSWQEPGVKSSFPNAVYEDGRRVNSTIETVWFDVKKRLARFHRVTRLTYPDGGVEQAEAYQQKHPVSAGEVRAWLEKHGFQIEQQLGDRQGNPYQDDSPRAIFLAARR
jgi:SAM-dependent methyltransferase